MAFGHIQRQLCYRQDPCASAIETRAWSRPLRGVKADNGVLLCYLEGWAETNPAKIAAAVAGDYRFHDPLVGVFTKWSLLRYFETLRTRSVCRGANSRRDLAFFLHGPTDEPSLHGEIRFWREAPRLGLTGVTRIKICDAGVMAENVAYDLNLAADLLRADGCR